MKVAVVNAMGEEMLLTRLTSKERGCMLDGAKQLVKQLAILNGQERKADARIAELSTSHGISFEVNDGGINVYSQDGVLTADARWSGTSACYTVAGSGLYSKQRAIELLELAMKD